MTSGERYVLNRCDSGGQPDALGECDGCGRDTECWWIGWFAQWQLCSDCREERMSAIEDVLSDDPALIELLLADVDQSERFWEQRFGSG